MYDHNRLKVKDVREECALLQGSRGREGSVRGSQDDSGAGFGPKDAPALGSMR